VRCYHCVVPELRLPTRSSQRFVPRPRFVTTSWDDGTTLPYSSRTTICLPQTGAGGRALQTRFSIGLFMLSTTLVIPILSLPGGCTAPHIYAAAAVMATRRYDVYTISLVRGGDGYLLPRYASMPQALAALTICLYPPRSSGGALTCFAHTWPARAAGCIRLPAHFLIATSTTTCSASWFARGALHAWRGGTARSRRGGLLPDRARGRDGTRVRGAVPGAACRGAGATSLLTFSLCL